MVFGNGRMERIRADLLRRARNERQRDADTEQQQHSAQVSTNRGENSVTGEAPTSSPRSILSRVPPFPRPLTRRTTHDEVPKSPEPPLRPLTLASSRYSGSGNPPSSLPSPIPMAQLQPQPQRPIPPQPAATSAQQQESPSDWRQNPPLQPTLIPTNIEDEQRRAQTQTSQDGQDSQDSSKPHPKRFMFFFPWVKSRRVRSQILTCFVSGMFLAILLAVYLGLALTNHIARGELTIMIILVILSATMFFCYSVIRLCVLVSRGDRARHRRYPEMMGPGGYVIPPKPIPVVLARDEEAVGLESEAAKSHPPAYGLWRESVRVDPNRLFWQRNEAAEQMPQRPETRTGPRPPSYASDDGISYVVEARPRSIAPPPSVYTVPASEVPPVPR